MRRIRASRATVPLTVAALTLAATALAAPAASASCVGSAEITSPAAPTPPQTRTPVGGTVTIAGSVHDGYGLDSSILRVLQDGTPAGPESPLSAGAPTAGIYPITGSRDTRALPDGNYTFRLVGIGGACEFTADALVRVDNTGPTLAIAAGPAEGETVGTGSAVSFGFTAQDPSGPVTLECSFDGAAPTGCLSPTPATTLAAGQHTFRVVATDALGNASAVTRSFGYAAAPAPQPAGGGGPPAAPRCRVPRLIGLSLTQATSRLKHAQCGLGKVTRPPRRTLKGRRLVVRSQALKPGATRASGQPVGVTLGPRLAPKRN